MKRIFPDAPLTPAQRRKRNYDKHRIALLQRNREYHQNNRETIKVRHRNNRHKITQERFDNQFAAQNGKCAICLELFTKTPHIDHNHECCPSLTSCDSCRRGLLCDDCNLGLGRFKDNIRILQNAIDYLNTFKGLTWLKL